MNISPWGGGAAWGHWGGLSFSDKRILGVSCPVVPIRYWRASHRYPRRGRRDRGLDGLDVVRHSVAGLFRPCSRNRYVQKFCGDGILGRIFATIERSNVAQPPNRAEAPRVAPSASSPFAYSRFAPPYGLWACVDCISLMYLRVAFPNRPVPFVIPNGTKICAACAV